METPSPPRRVAVVGAGRAGAALAHTLRGAGWPVVACWSRSQARAEAARAVLEAPARWGLDEAALSATVADAEVVLLTVADDAIRDMARRLAPALTPGQVLLHASGSLGSDALAVEGMRAQLGSFHPLQALVDPAQAPAALTDAFIAIEGAPAARDVARGMAAAIGAQPVEVAPAGKAAYHASAVLISNCLVTLFEASMELMNQASIDRATARAMLQRLARGTLDNLTRVSPVRALTGPARRGDAATIARHLEALTASTPGTAKLYRDLLAPTLHLARRAGLEPAQADAIAALLAEPES